MNPVKQKLVSILHETFKATFKVFDSYHHRDATHKQKLGIFVTTFRRNLYDKLYTDNPITILDKNINNWLYFPTRMDAWYDIGHPRPNVKWYLKIDENEYIAEQDIIAICKGARTMLNTEDSSCNDMLSDMQNTLSSMQGLINVATVIGNDAQTTASGIKAVATTLEEIENG